eukprot:2257090-Pyramimonas_sp.AAC.1
MGVSRKVTQGFPFFKRHVKPYASSTAHDLVFAPISRELPHECGKRTSITSPRLRPHSTVFVPDPGKTLPRCKQPHIFTRNAKIMKLT